jgi:hypothetical protein
MEHGMLKLALVSLFLSTAANGQALKLSKYPKVFKGEEGVVVTVVTVMPETSNKALVQVTGIDNEDLDGKVFLHEIQDQGRTKAMVLVVDGQERTRLRAEQDYWWKQFNLYLPMKEGSIGLYYDEKASKAANAGKLLAQYNKTDKKLQDKLAQFNRKANEARHNEELAKVDKDTTTTCGTPIKTSIAWKSVTDDVLKEYSIYSFCGEVADRLDSLCRDDAKMKASAKKIAKVNCQFGPKLKLTRAGDTINLTVEPETPNQEDFVASYLKNELD